MRAHLQAALAEVGARLGASEGDDGAREALAAARDACVAHDVVPPLEWLSERYGIDAESLDAVLAVLAIQRDPRVAERFRAWSGVDAIAACTERGPTLASVCAALAQGTPTDRDASWDQPGELLGTPYAPGGTPSDRIWDLGLLVPSVAAARPLPHVPVHVPSHWPASWVGERVLSADLWSVARRIEPTFPLETCLVPDEWRETLAHTLAGFFEGRRPSPSGFWAPEGHETGLGLLLVVSGTCGVGKSVLVRGLAQRHGRAVIELDGAALAADPRCVALFRLALIEAQLYGELVHVEGAEQLFGRDASGVRSLLRVAAERHVALVLETRRSGDLDERVMALASLAYDLPSPHKQARAMHWQVQVPEDAVLDTDVDPSELAERHALNGLQIRTATALALVATAGSRAEGESMPVLTQQQLLLAAALQEQRGGDGSTPNLLQSGRPGAQLADLVLPDGLAERLDEIVFAIDRRKAIMQQWGLNAVFHRGVGIVCLFDGPSGVGKTHCAEWLAERTGLVLRRVRSSQVSSKYIGETEKRLEDIFASMDPERHLLLFDEADSFFSKRTSVSRATDRYSNMEINTLLQLIEGFSGVVVLTTNLKDQMDKAFERRITYLVRFTMPDADARRRIWRALLPPSLPLGEDVDVDALAEDFPLSGGGIKNVILRASYAGAREGVVTQAQLASKARDEAIAGGILIRQRQEDRAER